MDPGENPLLARMRRKCSPLQRSLMAAGECRRNTNALPSSELEEEHDLDADLAATPALFASTFEMFTVSAMCDDMWSLDYLGSPCTWRNRLSMGVGHTQF
ncbi:hypothetical protein NDU88_002824 [Pleurodeles waltl]|uniref:Uncharacterized protein n=1 Tax=Pleurodeles waltl TaxID=8319 RepID=A0AAV7RF31_PLEWA|nr:hypothetical protein NDU88_002824 [Pleurodeles waltl]